MTSNLPSQMGPPPFVTPDLPGIGGSIKAEPAHFVVEEIPLYQPSGDGPHLFLRISREGMTTRQLADGLADVFGLPRREVGFAGLKDKEARTVQAFSLYLPGVAPQEAARQVADKLPVQVLEAAMHNNKLKTGHLLGNRFLVLLSGVEPGAEEKARAIGQALAQRGLPNFYGHQRFGMEADNAQRGRQALLDRGPRDKWLRKLLLSAWQAALFNYWLAQRMERGDFARLLFGDLAKKTETGGMFTVEDVAVDQGRLDAGELTYTGPMYGKKMRWPNDQAREYEERVLEAEGVDQVQLKKAGLMGSRRAARLMIAGLQISPADGGLVFSFALPKGSYATVLMREFS